MNIVKLYEKMVDYRRFAIVLLIIGSFFYLGTIIPSDSKVTSDIYIAAEASAGFLSLSIAFFFLSKKCRKKLIESEEGQDLLMKK